MLPWDLHMNTWAGHRVPAVTTHRPNRVTPAEQKNIQRKNKKENTLGFDLQKNTWKPE